MKIIGTNAPRLHIVLKFSYAHDPFKFFSLTAIVSRASQSTTTKVVSSSPLYSAFSPSRSNLPVNFNGFMPPKFLIRQLALAFGAFRRLFSFAKSRSKRSRSECSRSRFAPPSDSFLKMRDFGADINFILLLYASCLKFQFFLQFLYSGAASSSPSVFFF